MKQKNSRRYFGRMCISILILFVLGEVVGYLTIRSLFLKYEITELLPQAEMAATEYSDGQALHTSPGRIIAIYDQDKNEVNTDSKEDVLSSLDLSELVDQYFDTIVENEDSITTIKKISGLSSVALVIGVPVFFSDGSTGVLFQMIPANEYTAALRGFWITFAITILVGIGLIAFFFWKYYEERKRLEHLQQDYITNINHELKSPIASIRALSETLADGMIEDETSKQRYYQIICEESKKLETLVQNSLQLSHLQNRHEKMEKQKIEMDELLQPIIDKYEIICNDMGITFSLKINGMSQLLAYTNPDGIRQILTIFMENALKFVDEDGEISLELEKKNRQLKIMVTDNGIGIEEEAIPYIFERFYKENKAHNTKGSGLGLAIAKEVAEQLQESIQVASRPKMKTVFSITVHMA